MILFAVSNANSDSQIGYFIWCRIVQDAFYEYTVETSARSRICCFPAILSPTSHNRRSVLRGVSYVMTRIRGKALRRKNNPPALPSPAIYSCSLGACTHPPTHPSIHPCTPQTYFQVVFVFKKLGQKTLHETPTFCYDFFFNAEILMRAS